jgi:N-hydroxyarylamine O-acetyltransferase
LLRAESLFQTCPRNDRFPRDRACGACGLEFDTGRCSSQNTHAHARRSGGESFIADVGFGGVTLTAPLRLQLETVQRTPHGAFRLMREVEEFVLEAELGHEWKQLYKFTLHEQLLPDYEMANYYVSCHPKSRFVNRLIVARPAENRRYALLNNEFTVRFMNGQTERRVLRTAADIRDVLEGPMGLKLPSAPELDLRLQRLL